MIFGQDHNRHGFEERDACLKKCDSLRPVKSRLEVTLHDVCQGLEEEEPQDLRVGVVRELLEEFYPVLVIVLNKLIA